MARVSRPNPPDSPTTPARPRLIHSIAKPVGDDSVAMAHDTVRPACPRCEAAFDLPQGGAGWRPPQTVGAPPVGQTVTCEECGAEFEVYFYR
jgi:hypothetical protein